MFTVTVIELLAKGARVVERCLQLPLLSHPHTATAIASGNIRNILSVKIVKCSITIWRTAKFVL